MAGNQAARPVVAPSSPAPPPAPQHPSRRRWPALSIVALVVIVAGALGYVFWPLERDDNRVPAPTISTPPSLTEPPRQPPADASIRPPAPIPPPGQRPEPAGGDAARVARLPSPGSEPVTVAAPSPDRTAVSPGAGIAPRGLDPVDAPTPTPPIETAPIETPPAAPPVAITPADAVPPSPAIRTPDAVAGGAAPAPPARTVVPDPSSAIPPARRFDGESASLASIVRSYELAYDRLDAAAAAALWPSVDERALARAFARLQTQDLEFDDCTFVVSDNEATAQCAGLLQYSRRIGDPSLKRERHVWTIEFVRKGESWRIARITAR